MPGSSGAATWGSRGSPPRWAWGPGCLPGPLELQAKLQPKAHPARRLCRQPSPRPSIPSLERSHLLHAKILPLHRAKATAPLSLTTPTPPHPPPKLQIWENTGGWETGKGSRIYFAPLPQGWIFKPAAKGRRAAGGRQPAGAMNKYPGRNQSGERGKGRNIDIGHPAPRLQPPGRTRTQTHTH